MIEVGRVDGQAANRWNASRGFFRARSSLLGFVNVRPTANFNNQWNATDQIETKPHGPGSFRIRHRAHAGSRPPKARGWLFPNGCSAQVRAVHEGTADSIQIGLRGLMGSMFLTDLAHKVRRGLQGVVRDGRSAGGYAFGYRPILDW